MEKNQHIETLRGLAMLLVIIFHVSEFLRLESTSIWRQSHIPFDYLRMPLFTVISGFVYSLRPVSKKYSWAFLKKKMVRLLLPAWSWSFGTFMAFGFAYSYFDWSNFLKIFYLPFHQFWFLQSLITVFFVVVLMEIANCFSNTRKWFITLIVSLGMIGFYVYVWPAESTSPLVVMSFFSQSGVVYLMPFFLLGIGIQRFFYFNINKRMMVGLFLAFISGVFIREMVLLGYLNDQIHLRRDGMIGMAIGIFSCIWVMNTPLNQRHLAYVGSLAYPIYLIHMMAQVIIINLIQNQGITSNKILFPSMVIGSVILPIILTVLVDQFLITRYIFLGTKKPYQLLQKWPFKVDENNNLKKKG